MNLTQRGVDLMMYLQFYWAPTSVYITPKASLIFRVSVKCSDQNQSDSQIHENRNYPNRFGPGPKPFIRPGFTQNQEWLCFAENIPALECWSPAERFSSGDWHTEGLIGIRYDPTREEFLGAERHWINIFYGENSRGRRVRLWRFWSEVLLDGEWSSGEGGGVARQWRWQRRLERGEVHRRER